MNDLPAPIPTAYTIRPATDLDVEQINGIINHEIAETVNNFNYGPRSLEDGLAWFRATIAGGYPVFVATTTTAGEGGEGGEEVVAGYSSLGSFRQKDGYRFTAEYSVYIHHEHRRRGLGKRLLKDLLIEAKLRNFHSIIGSISEGNQTSIDLAKAFGFRVVGTMKDNGYKFGRWIDNTFLELVFV
ncbi:hypothetical protein BGZ95_011546 [Linnemannia exigua]|uniref:N-acetyltransferase domain-containing protein n=1 Tax=Linnemannia exigua TaxID=604196 RepID=A0AAD4DAA6_9FUNG|nr:hypothetical protein BGZ95_011546 [Linnemannia exigua]